MRKHPVFVRKIRHLTDARYFAAMGVEWMSIVLTPEPATFAFWHAIRDWVEGVKLAAEVDVRDEELLARVIIEAEPNGLVPSDWKVVEIPEHIELFYPMLQPDQTAMPLAGTLIWPYNQGLNWDQIAPAFSPDRIFLECDWTLSLLEEVLSAGYTGGICFRGGEEEVKGVRDYEVMDAMLGRLGKA